MDTDNSVNYSNKDFGDALYDLKKASGLSYVTIAKKAGLSDSYIVKLINGQNLPPNDENMAKIAHAFDKPPEYFKEYRNRRLTEKMQNLNFHMDDYDVQLSPEEIAYIKKIIEQVEKSQSK